jgi:branched-chain amino acid transport system ATP-binding protein
VREAELKAREKAEEVIEFLNLHHYRDLSWPACPMAFARWSKWPAPCAPSPNSCCSTSPPRGLNVEETDDMAFWIQDIKHELGITVLMVEHDMSLVSKVSDRVLGHEPGRNAGHGHAARSAKRPRRH